MGELNCCQKNFSPEIELHTGASTNDSSYNIEKRDQKINNKLNSEKDKQITALQNKINEYMKMLNNKNNIITKLQSEVEILRNKDSKKNNPKKKIERFRQYWRNMLYECDIAMFIKYEKA